MRVAEWGSGEGKRSGKIRLGGARSARSLVRLGLILKATGTLKVFFTRWEDVEFHDLENKSSSQRQVQIHIRKSPRVWQ